MTAYSDLDDGLLLAGFFKLPRHVYPPILDTLRSDKPIAVGDWFVQHDEEFIGCLMADDMERRDASRFARFRQLWWNRGGMNAAFNQLRGYDLQDLASFYNLGQESVGDLISAAKSFDHWAVWKHYTEPKAQTLIRFRGVLTDQGRQRLITLIEAHLERLDLNETLK